MPGRQMEILAASTWLRYLEQCGERFVFPANGYRGDYIVAMRRTLYAAEGTALRQEPAEIFKDLAAGRTAGRRQGHRTSMRSSSRARRLIGDAAFRRVLDLALAGILGDIREDLGGVRRDFRFLVLASVR